MMSVTTTQTQKALLTELARYISEKEPSVWMVHELRNWVISGHSVYSNPWSLTAEDGSSLDYLSAKELIDAQKLSSEFPNNSSISNV